MTEPAKIDRRTVLIGATAAAAGCSGWTAPAHAASAPTTEDAEPSVTLVVNGASYALNLDPRTSLLDALREHIGLTGTKKGCDHGQCGACTVILNGRRINSCLTLAVMHDGEAITTIEGLGGRHPMQAAFVKHDAFQCGYCTSGQICSSIAMLEEIKAGAPSHVTENLTAHPPQTAPEYRERMSGNICRCGAYSNILDAIAEVAGAV